MTELYAGKIGVSYDYITKGEEGTIYFDGKAYNAKAYEDIEKAREVIIINVKPLLVAERKVRTYKRDLTPSAAHITGTGNILTITPAKEKYAVLSQINQYAEDIGATHYLEGLCTDNTWRIIDAWMFSANESNWTPYPEVKLDKFKYLGADYKIKKGDGSTATIRVRSIVGANAHSATVYYHEES